MMNEFFAGCALVLASALISAFSQLLLKLAARKNYNVWWRSYLNGLVIAAYGMFFGTTLFNAIAMRFIPLSLAAALESSSQIFVAFISVVFLKEKLSKRKLAGLTLIVLGIILFSI